MIAIRCNKFQVGDRVRTPKGTGIITRTGAQYVDGKVVAIVYRIGRRQYWHEWQLRLEAIAKWRTS